MQDGHEQVLVPRSLRQDIMKEHHDVSPLDTWVYIGLWTTSSELLVERPVGRHWTIRAILSGLSAHEVRPQEKGGFTTTNPLATKEMAIDHD